MFFDKKLWKIWIIKIESWLVDRNTLSCCLSRRVVVFVKLLYPSFVVLSSCYMLILLLSVISYVVDHCSLSREPFAYFILWDYVEYVIDVVILFFY